jgi:FkbM family methyltransferase
MQILKKIKKFIENPIIRIIKYWEHKKQNFIIKFLYEGNIEIKTPKLSFMEAFLGYGIFAKRSFYLMSRPYSEILLRNIIYNLFKDKYLKTNFSIIDIGSWIGDNALIWAKNLSENAMVFAIEPSEKNIDYARTLADLNNIKNIEWFKQVCSENVGDKLIFEKTPTNHSDNIKFKVGDTKDSISSSTIDHLVYQKNTEIGLIHIDVEGFELKVIKGASKIIERDKPTLVFEQHISQEDPDLIFKYLKTFGYRIFMINEVIPGNDLDCRNFIAFHSSKKLPSFEKFTEDDLKNLGISRSTIGPGLIEF